MTYGKVSTGHGAPTRELRDISSPEGRVRRDEGEERRGCHMERAAIPSDNGHVSGVIRGRANHRGSPAGTNCGHPGALEARVPGLDLDPVVAEPSDVGDITGNWPDYRRLMP